ncbi:hypothetical protein BD769DRAFT_1438204 [Suillus cothurnatus]|nr:hypothetical protein BD769DRAFT_1438204 [Suillus cothurnatus]
MPCSATLRLCYCLSVADTEDCVADISFKYMDEISEDGTHHRVPPSSAEQAHFRDYAACLCNYRAQVSGQPERTDVHAHCIVFELSH